MRKTAASLQPYTQREVSNTEIYQIMEKMICQMSAVLRELDELRAGQGRLVDSNLNALYSPKDIAARIGVHHHTVLAWIRQGRLVPTEGTRVSGWELERFLQQSTKYSAITGV